MTRYAYFIDRMGTPVRVTVDAEGDYESAEAWHAGRYHPASDLIPDILMKGEAMEVSENAFMDYLARRDPGPHGPSSD